MNTDTPPPCPNCGEPIPPEAPDGLCPECLLGGVLEQSAPPPGESNIDEVRANFPGYDVLELIGVGGIGRVYKIRDPRIDRVVALKVLSPDRVNDPEWIERFTREAKALARLNHPQIVQVHAFGSDPQPHLIMEFVEGVNLRQVMESGGLSAREALVIVPKLCDALHYAHENGVLHRDIKPENILVDTEGRVKLVDFGLAKLHDDGVFPFTLTQSGAKLGTIAYMAPEQIEKPSDVDHRADIYSLGVVFYEMLTGELPLGRFPSPSEAKGTDSRLDGVVLRTLEKKKENRFPDAETMGTEIGLASRSDAPTPKKDAGTSASTRKIWKIAALILGISFLGVLGSMMIERKRETGASTMAAKANDEERFAEEKRVAERETRQQTYELARNWISEASRTDDEEAKAAAIGEMLDAVKSDDRERNYAGLSAFNNLGSIKLDRSVFREPVRRLVATEDLDWDIRGHAISALFATDYEDSDVELVLGLVETVPIDHLHYVGWALATDNKKDFTEKYAEPMLRLLQRGFEMAKSGSYRETGFDSRYILGVLWGAKVSPEIEELIVEWSKLGSDENGQIMTSSHAYNAFYHALSVLANKSTISVERLLLLARNADVTNIGGRCLWGLEHSVADEDDQKLVAASVIELLGERNGDYQWREGLDLVRKFATAEHLPALRELAAREALPPPRKESLLSIAESLSP